MTGISARQSHAIAFAQGARDRFFAILFLLISAFCLIAPQVVEAQTLRVNSIVVEGNERVDARTIQSYAGIRRGDTVSAAQINDAYQRIMASGLFESVAVTPRGGTIVITVQEYPTVLRVNFEGNRRLNAEKLNEVILTRARRVYNPSQVEADARSIAELYSTEGRMAARVEPRVIRRQGNAVDVVFEIAEGRQTEIERISFIGNRNFSDRRLRGVLQTRQAGLLRAFVSSDVYSADRIEADKQMLSDFYLSRGFIDFQVTDATAEIARERDGFFVTFTLREGLQYRVGNVNVVSEYPDVTTEGFEELIRIRSGVVYSPVLIENAVARMESRAGRLGYDFLRVDPRFTRDDANQLLNVEFAIVRGPRIFVERIDIEGNSATRDEVIRRQFRSAEGDPLNPREIREAAQRIRALGFFASANVDARQGSAADQVIVRAEVEEAPTGSLSIGASYGTTSGFGATFSLSETNLMGRGQGLNLSLGLGGDYQNAAIRFTEPAFLGRDLRFVFDAAYSSTQATAYAPWDSREIRFRPSFEFPLTERARLELRYGLRYSGIENLTAPDGVNLIAPGSSILDAEVLSGPRLASSLGYNLSWDSRRSGIVEDYFYLLRFGQDVAGLGGDAQFIKTEALAVAETKVLGGNITLRAEGEAGALVSFGGTSGVMDRYFLNGKMRGFQPFGVGPRENGYPLGGNFYAVARLEAEFPIGLPERLGIKGGAFVDVGSVWGLDNPGVVDDGFNMRAAAGLSLFWNSPIGPLRFNFSQALSKQSYDREQQFDLSISTRF